MEQSGEPSSRGTLATAARTPAVAAVVAAGTAALSSLLLFRWWWAETSFSSSHPCSLIPAVLERWKTSLKSFSWRAAQPQPQPRPQPQPQPSSPSRPATETGVVASPDSELATREEPPPTAATPEATDAPPAEEGLDPSGINAEKGEGSEPYEAATIPVQKLDENQREELKKEQGATSTQHVHSSNTPKVPPDPCTKSAAMAQEPQSLQRSVQPGQPAQPVPQPQATMPTRQPQQLPPENLERRQQPSSQAPSGQKPPVAKAAVQKGFFNKTSKQAQPKKAEARAAEPQVVAAASAPEAERETCHPAVADEYLRGLRCLREGSFDEAVSRFTAVRAMAKDAKLGVEEGRACRLLGEVLSRRRGPNLGGEDAEVDELFKQAMRLAHREDNMELSFATLCSMGAHAARTGDVDLAEHFFLQSKTLAQRVLSSSEEGIAEANLALCLGQEKARHSECVDSFKKAIRLQQGQSGSKHKVAVLHIAFATALTSWGRCQEAKGELVKALTLAQSCCDKRTELRALLKLVKLLELSLKDASEAAKYRELLRSLHGGVHRLGGVENGLSDLAEERLCGLCLCKLESEESSNAEVLTLPCHHRFHPSCWEAKSPEVGCPECDSSCIFIVDS